MGSRRRDGVELCERRGLRALECEAQRLGGSTDACVEVVPLTRRTFPDPAPVLGEGRQRCRVWVVPETVTTLLARCLAHRGAQVGEVGQVLAPGAENGRLVLRALAPPVDDDEPERGDEEHPAGDQATWPW